MRNDGVMRKNARFNYIVSIFLAGIIVFTLFRVAETIVYCSQAEEPIELGGLYWKSLLIGLWFDTVVSCYILALPLLLMAIGEIVRIRKRTFYVIVHYTCMVLYTVAFFACAADIPYFCYFFSRLDVVALNWIESFPVMASMILSEPRYVIYLLVFIAVAVGWWLIGRLLSRRLLLNNIDKELPMPWSITLTIVLAALLFVGMRGKIFSKIPIRVGTAYFCNNPFLNQIGLNPVFTFIKSIESSGKSANTPLELTDKQTADELLEELRAIPIDTSLAEAALRLPENTNVVLILMESMSANKTGLCGEKTSLTPCLDSLMKQSITFIDFYSAGIHTYNGIYSTLYGHPALLTRQLMKSTPMPHVCGLPQALSDNGYSTTYFMTHDEDYDNMRGFLYQNGFERVVGQHNYPASEIVGTWGVPDHVMLDHVIEHCDSAMYSGPFFVCAMTCSDHGPYIIPDGIDFQPKNKEIKKQIVEYADWSIGQFINKAASRPWFSNTLFIFVADHGASMDITYDMSLSYNHVPLLFYHPGYLAPHFIDRLGLQIDIPATTLGLLGIEHKNKTMGINLLRQKRPYAYFSADDKIGVVDSEYFYIYRTQQESQSLYRYRNRSTEDLSNQFPKRTTSMKRHAFGMIQASQQMIIDGKTRCD